MRSGFTRCQQMTRVEDMPCYQIFQSWITKSHYTTLHQTSRHRIAIAALSSPILEQNPLSTIKPYYPYKRLRLISHLSIHSHDTNASYPVSCTIPCQIQLSNRSRTVVVSYTQNAYTMLGFRSYPYTSPRFRYLLLYTNTSISDTPEFTHVSRP